MVVMIMGAKGGEYRCGDLAETRHYRRCRHGRAFENRDVCDCIFGTVDRIYPAVPAVIGTRGRVHVYLRRLKLLLAVYSYNCTTCSLRTTRTVV